MSELIKVKKSEMEEEKFLNNDDSVVTLNTREELENYLVFRKEHDVWVKPYVNECNAVGVANAPLLFPQCKEDNNIECADEMLEEAATDNGLLLVFPANNKMVVYPLRYTGFPDLCDRAGLNGRTMKLTENKGKFKALDPQIKGQWFSTGCSLNGEQCNILIRDGKVSNMKSKEYVIIPAHEAISALEIELSNSWENSEYNTGMVSHEYLIADYLLNDIAMEESLRLRLEDFGVNVTGEVKSGVRFSTSDVGTSCVTAAPYFIMGNVKVRVGDAIAVRHDGDNSINTFSDKLPMMATLLKEAEDQIEELGNTEIKDVAGCMQCICEEFKNLIPIKAAKTLLEELLLLVTQKKNDAKREIETMTETELRAKAYDTFVKCGLFTQAEVDGLDNDKLTQGLIKKIDISDFTSGTAVDVYIALNNIVNYQNNIKKMTPKELIKLSEGIAQLMYLDFKKYDQAYNPEK